MQSMDVDTRTEIADNLWLKEQVIVTVYNSDSIGDSCICIPIVTDTYIKRY